MLEIFSYTILTVLTVDLLATSGDITMTWTSPVFPKLYSNDNTINPLGKPITQDEESWIASLLNIGAMIGPFPYGFLAAKFGRKIALLCIAIPHIAAFLILAFARSVYLYYFARLLGGIAVGGGYALLPMYVAEISEDNNRGMLSTTINIFWGLGNLLSYILGPYMPMSWFNISLACVPFTFFVLFLLIAPETPYYLVKKDKIEKAEKSIMLLRSKTKVAADKEIEHIKTILQHDEHSGNFFDIFRNRILLKAFIISLVLIAAQQLSGITVVNFYTELIFESAGTEIPSDISGIIVGLAIFASSFICPFFVDRFGRRILLLISAIGMTFAHLLFGCYFYLKDNTGVDLQPIFWLPVFSLVFYILSFKLGFSALPWTVSSELFPISVKSTAASMVSCTCWITAFILTKFFNDFNDALGKGGTFWMFGGFCAVGAVFTYFFVPETKGKSFKEIQEILES